MSALTKQVGGSHYKAMKIQPVEFIHANGLGFLEGCIIKRICRFRDKNGLEDLEKIKHEVDLLIQMEYGEHVIPQSRIDKAASMAHYTEMARQAHEVPR